MWHAIDIHPQIMQVLPIVAPLDFSSRMPDVVLYPCLVALARFARTLRHTPAHFDVQTRLPPLVNMGAVDEMWFIIDWLVILVSPKRRKPMVRSAG
jgi:hypothetical protein